jgi:hypothetical protein
MHSLLTVLMLFFIILTTVLAVAPGERPQTKKLLPGQTIVIQTGQTNSH